MKPSFITFGLFRAVAPITALSLILLGSQCNNDKKINKEPVPENKAVNEKKYKEKLINY